MKRLTRLGREQRGQTFVETAIILPLILMLVFGSIVFGMMINAKLGTSGAAREAARYWGIHHAESDVSTGAREVAERYLRNSVLVDMSGITCALSIGRISGPPAPPTSTSSSGAGCRVEIDTETYANPFSGPSGPPDMVAVRVTFWQPTFAGGLLNMGKTTPISSTVIFRVEK